MISNLFTKLLAKLLMKSININANEQCTNTIAKNMQVHILCLSNGANAQKIYSKETMRLLYIFLKFTFASNKLNNANEGRLLQV